MLSWPFQSILELLCQLRGLLNNFKLYMVRHLDAYKSVQYTLPVCNTVNIKIFIFDFMTYFYCSRVLYGLTSFRRRYIHVWPAVLSSLWIEPVSIERNKSKLLKVIVDNARST